MNFFEDIKINGTKMFHETMFRKHQNVPQCSLFVKVAEISLYTLFFQVIGTQVY